MIKIFGLILFLGQFSLASNCDTNYNDRAKSLQVSTAAFECYAAEYQASKTVNEKLFLSASWVYNHNDNKDAKLELSNRVLKVLEEQKTHANYKYWHAVFLTFMSQQKDKGKIIPTTTMGNLSDIKAGFNFTNENQPSVHRYGAARNLGIMYMEMPAVVGGSNKKAKEFLEFAYNNDPKFTLNGIYLAKLYIKTSEDQKAKTILNQIIQLPETAMEPDWIPETKEDQAEAQKILGAL